MKRLIRGSAILTTPIIPRMESNTPTQGISTPRAQGLGPDAFGAGLAQGINRASKDALAIATEEREKADRVATINARTQLDQAEVDLLYHPQNGALAKRGKDAFSLEEPTLKAFDERTAQIENSLTTTSQKDAFRLLAAPRRSEIDKQLQRHISGEIKTYSDEANKASLTSTQNNVATHYLDPDRVEQERKFGLAVIMSDTDNKGLSPEVVKSRVAAWESMVHSTVIDKLMVDNPLKAKEYFESNKDKILATDAAKIERTIKPLATKQEGMNTALELAPLLNTKPLTEVLGEARTRLKSNPDALNIAETQIKQMESERRDQLKQESEAAAKPVYKRIADIQASGRAAKLSDIPPAEWAALIAKAPEEAGKIQDAIRRELQSEEDRRERKLDRAEREADRRERRAERGTVNQMLNWAALNGDPTSLMSVDLDKLYVTGNLGKDHYRELSKKQAELRTDPDKGSAIRTENQTVEDILAAGGIIKATENHGLAWDYVESVKRSFVKESGRQPTRKELEGFAREALYKVDVSGSVFDKASYKVHFEDIPAAERNKITDAFNRRGRKYTQDDVVRAYVRAKGAK